MDILFVRNLFRPRDFGGNRYPFEVTRRLESRGHHVRVVTPRFRGSLPSPTPVEFRHYPVSRRTPLETFVTNALLSQIVVRREIRRARPDVVVFSSYDVAFGHYVSRIQRSGPPTVYIYHSSFYSDAVDRVRTKPIPLRWMHQPLDQFTRSVERLTFERADRVIAVSPFSRREIEARLGRSDDKVWLIPTGVDTQLFAPGDQVDARRSFGLTAEAKVLLAVGRLSPVKRYDRAIDALERLRSWDGRYVLVIAGHGPEEDRLRARAESLGPGVRFVGFVDGLRLRDLYRASDVSLCTSEFENWSLSALESLATGTPVLGTPRGSIPDMLRPIDKSLVFRDVDPTVIAEDIHLFLQQSHSDLAARCRQVVVDLFSWDRTTAELESCLERLVRKSIQL